MTQIRSIIGAVFAPLFVRKFIVDFVETGVPVLLGLTAFGDASSFVHTVIVALGSAALSAARRATPGAFLWLRGVLGVPEG